MENLVQITVQYILSTLLRATKQEDSITYKTVLSETNCEEEDKLQPNSDPETITHPVQTGWRSYEYNYFSEQQSRRLWFSAAARGGVFRQKGHVVCQLILRMRTCIIVRTQGRHVTHTHYSLMLWFPVTTYSQHFVWAGSSKKTIVITYEL